MHITIDSGIKSGNKNWIEMGYPRKIRIYLADIYKLFKEEVLL